MLCIFYWLVSTCYLWWCLIFLSTEKNKSYAISSFVETKGEHFIAKNAVEFVEYPLHFIYQNFKNLLWGV